MNIIEAIKSGKKIKRPHQKEFLEAHWHRLNIENVIADDWETEIQEKTIAITESQFDEAFKQGNWSEVFKDDLKKRLGF